MTLLERAARALWCARADEFNDWDNLDGEEREALKLEARAMLMAVRGPSEAMVSNGARAVDSSPMRGGIRQDTKTAWIAMIDAALEGGK